MVNRKQMHYNAIKKRNKALMYNPNPKTAKQITAKDYKHVKSVRQAGLDQGFRRGVAWVKRKMAEGKFH